MQERRVDLIVHGLACGGGGALTVEHALRKRRGVLDAYVNPATRVASVRYDADLASTRALVDAIEDAGFSARDPDHWKRYVVETDPAEVARHLTITTFVSGGAAFELLHFDRGADAPAILVSPGSSGTARVFAELGFQLSTHGGSVYIMPKQGPHTIAELVQRHEDALHHIAAAGHDRIGVFGEGLGGYVAFYLALAHGPMHSLVCQNAPAIVTEEAYRRAIYAGAAGRRRRRLLPIARLLAKVTPRITLPISSYLDFRKMVDPEPPAHALEATIIGAYEQDPDFDRRYPLSAILSLLDTPPPAPLSTLAIPTMFLVPKRGIIPEYEKDLFARLPSIEKQLVEVDGSVFWMVSHPRQAAQIISAWFDRTLGAGRRRDRAIPG